MAAQMPSPQTHAWFDYESETTGQPNWCIQRGQPYRHLYSYEDYYDKGSIGRVLSFNEWQESQAWQALSAYESYRKKRWLDYDGMTWCPLRGGGNTATYMKPLVDYRNHAKLAYHALGMVFQDVLAGSRNVDLVYGPDDTVPVMVLNLGSSSPQGPARRSYRGAFWRPLGLCMESLLPGWYCWFHKRGR